MPHCLRNSGYGKIYRDILADADWIQLIFVQLNVENEKVRKSSGRKKKKIDIFKKKKRTKKEKKPILVKTFDLTTDK